MAHTGNLKSDSGALYFLFERRFSPAELEKLEALYSWVAARGGIAEGAVGRKPEASFNPRVARVCQLVLGEGGATTILDAAATMLATLPTPHQAPEEYKEALLLANAARDFKSLTQSAEAERISLALIIDTTRHIHMFELREAKPAAILEAKEYLSRKASSSSNARLWEMLAFALEQQERLWERDK